MKCETKLPAKTEQIEYTVTMKVRLLSTLSLSDLRLRLVVALLNRRASDVIRDGKSEELEVLDYVAMTVTEEPPESAEATEGGADEFV